MEQLTSPPLTHLLLAAHYHESVRVSVAAGHTLAHATGQAKPFTELADLSTDALRGRLLTAAELLKRFDITGVATLLVAGAPDPEQVQKLAQALHECERPAIDKGWVVVKLDPPRPWIAFADMPAVAKQGRFHQACYLLSRFAIVPRTEQSEVMTGVDDPATGRLEPEDDDDLPGRLRQLGNLMVNAESRGLLRDAADACEAGERLSEDNGRLADFIMAEHASTNLDGSPKVDELAAAPMEGETPASVALRLLRLAHQRGAFKPGERSVLEQQIAAYQEWARALGQHIVETHKPGQVDAAAVAILDGFHVGEREVAGGGAGEPGETTLEAALRLLKLAYDRGAFQPGEHIHTPDGPAVTATSEPGDADLLAEIELLDEEKQTPDASLYRRLTARLRTLLKPAA